MKKTINFNLPVQGFTNISVKLSDLPFTLGAFLSGHNDKNDYRQKIDNLRSLEYKSPQYKETKKKLPMFLVCGYSPSGKATNNDVTTSYNICSIDIDYGDNKEVFNKLGIDKLRDTLFDKVPSAFCAMKSCGGQGIVLYLSIDDNVKIMPHNSHKIYEDLTNYFKKIGKEICLENGIESTIIIDGNCNNILSRKRIISYDKDCKLRNEVEPYVYVAKTEIKEIKHLNVKEATHEDYIEESLEVNDVDDIKYLDMTRRYQYCYTLKQLWGKQKREEIIRVVKKIYDKFFHKKYKSENQYNKNQAYTHIIASCNNSTHYIVPNILKELQLLGIVKKEEENKGNTQNEMVIELQENEFLYDKKDEILSFFQPGFNMLISGTGTGKTEFWKQFSKDSGRRICIVEPYNAVVNNKYKAEEVHIAAGNRRYIDFGHKTNVTNYYKFWYEGTITEETDEPYEKTAEDIAEDIFFGNCESDKDKKKSIQKKIYWDYVIVDESHLIGTQDFRGEQLISFIHKLKAYIEEHPDGKVIFQTATPSNENISFGFDIKSTVEVKKRTDKNVSIKFIDSEYLVGYTQKSEKIYERGIILSCLHFARILKAEGRKVMIYWEKGGLSDMKKFRKMAESENINVAIYHKKNLDETGKYSKDMEDIDEKKMIGDYDVLITSCYFSVGCDLKDDGDAGIIIVGINPYQTDEQVIGRFRESKNIKVMILCRCEKIPKIDSDYMFDCELLKAKQLNNVKRDRPDTICLPYNKSLTDEDAAMMAHMIVATDNYSDMKKKFNFFTEREYEINNRLFEGSQENNVTGKIEHYYNICENGEDEPRIYYFEEEFQRLREIRKRDKELLDDAKKSFLKELKQDPYKALKEIANENKGNPKYNSWLEALLRINESFRLKDFFREVDEKTILEMKKKQLEEILAFYHNLVKKRKPVIEATPPTVEERVLYHMMKEYDELSGDDKTEKFEMVLVEGFLWWCANVDNEKEGGEFGLDTTNNIYHTFNRWRKTMKPIVKVPAKLRDFILRDFKQEEPNILFSFDSGKIGYLGGAVVNSKYKKEDAIRFYNTMRDNIKNKNSKQMNGRMGGRPGKKVTIEGNDYPSLTEAAQRLGVSRKKLKKDYFPEVE